MRRCVVSVALLALLLPGCTSQERPEGIVERWLLALNQGSAGEPLRYADADVTDALLPEWRSAEPGTFDVIEVGKGAPCGRGPIGCERAVPFRVELVDGGRFRLVAFVIRSHGTDATRRRVGAMSLHPDETPALPSEGGAPIGTADLSVWLEAVGIGIVVTVAAEALMRLPRRRRAG
jgi:hypothetical protein